MYIEPVVISTIEIPTLKILIDVLKSFISSQYTTNKYVPSLLFTLIFVEGLIISVTSLFGNGGGVTCLIITQVY